MSPVRCEGWTGIWLVGRREDCFRPSAGQIAGLRRAGLVFALFTAACSRPAQPWCPVNICGGGKCGKKLSISRAQETREGTGMEELGRRDRREDVLSHRLIARLSLRAPDSVGLR